MAKGASNGGRSDSGKEINLASNQRNQEKQSFKTLYLIPNIDSHQLSPPLWTP